LIADTNDLEWPWMAISCQNRFSCQLFYSEHSTFKAQHKKNEWR